MQGQVKTYRGSQTSATNEFRRDAARMATQGLVPTTQTWAAGSYGCGSFVLAFLLCFILIGFLIFLYMLIVKPAGTLTVTYAYQAAAPATAPEKVCPKCAEHVKAAATVCRFCGFAFPENTMPPAASTVSPEAFSRPSPQAVEAGRQAGSSMAALWRTKWVRVLTYSLAGLYAIVYVSNVVRGLGSVSTGQSQTAVAEQAAQPVDSQRAAQIKTDQEDCKSNRSTQLASYNDLVKQGKDWEAAVEIRHCAQTLADPEMNKLVAESEIKSRLTDIRSVKSTKAERLQAMKALLRDYPEAGKPYESKIPTLEAQIAKESAFAESARRRKEGVHIGMTEDEVRQSSWGRPESVNRTIMANGTHEQWVYSGGYLYFEDGVLTSIQN